MPDFEQLQKGLLYYFFAQLERSKSIRVIKEVCYSLYRQHASEDDPRIVANKSLQEIFYPLFRWGIIDSSGNEKFVLSPTAALSGGHHILAINFYLPLPIDIEIVYHSEIGIKVLRKNITTLQWLERAGLPAVPFDIEREIHLMRSINAIVDQWPNDDTERVGGQYFLGAKGWGITASTDKPGIYRTSHKIYSSRILQLSSGKRKRIPARQSNSEAYRLARLYSLPSSCSKLLFDSTHQTLHIRTSGFPVLLERMLFIQSMLMDPHRTDASSRQYIIDPEIIKQLNQLINHKIQLYEKCV